MSYTLHREPQGSDEWLAGRNTRLNASELVLAAGDGMNGRTRTDLIRKMATGIEPEVEAFTQKLYDEGHRFESLARPLAEEIIGETLYPITASIKVDGLTRPLGASMDGATASDEINFEHKRMNAALRAALAQGIIPVEYHWQTEQGQMINGATRTLFMASEWEKVPDGEDEEGQVYGIAIDENGYQARYVLVEEKHAWYESNPVLRDRIIPIWKQTEEDAANYQHVEAAPVAVAAPIKDLPAVVLTVSGELAIKTNFDAWRVELQQFIDYLPERIPERLSTDQEFADCKAAIAAFKKAEAQLDAEESRVLNMVDDINQMQRTKKLLRDLSSTTRLILEKRAVKRDQEVKIEITQAGKDEFAETISNLNIRLGDALMPVITADWAAAIKGKKLYSSMEDAVADLLAQKKIEAYAIADKIDANLKLLDAAKEHAFLFHDRATLVMKDAETLALYIKSRITEHQAIEAKRLEAIKEAARIEAEANAAAKVKAEQEEADRKRIAAGREANAKAREAAMPKVTETIDHGDGIKTIIVEPAAQAPLGVSGGTATPVAAAPTHKGMTGSARQMDRLDDLARQMTERELSDLCIHAAHILENRRVAA